MRKKQYDLLKIKDHAMNRILWIMIFFSIIIPAHFLTVSTSCKAAPGMEEKGERATVIDCSGRSVAIPQKVERIACLYTFAGHIVTMLGKGDQIIAVSNGLKRDSILHAICPSIMDAKVPKAPGGINIEELIRSEPDIVFFGGDMGIKTGEIEKMEKFNIPYLIIDYNSIETQQYAIEVIGKVLEVHEKSIEFNGYYQDCIKRVSAVKVNIPPEQRVSVYYSINEALRTTMDKGLTEDWLRVVNVRNVAENIDLNLLDGKNFVSLEQIHIWDPQVILANESKVVEQILKDRQWAAITAVKQGSVFQMPLALSRWGHPGSIETPLAILWTAKKLYPELFSDIDMKRETKSFYKRFFNYELTDELTKNILSGKTRRKPKKR